MSKKQKWFTLYEESAAASNLSIAGGAVKLAALLLMIAAIPCTLALLLAGYLQPTEGQILLDGRPLPRKGVCPVQLIYQHPGKAINPRWRLRQVLEESGRVREDMLDAFGIERAWLDRLPRELPGGELQLFCVARALMSGADFLIGDEISTMLDVSTQAQIWEVVLAEAARRDMGLIAVTHNRHLADRICTRGLDLRSLDAGKDL